jgi:hypothetical protein
MVENKPGPPISVTSANPAKAGDAKLRGYRARSRATPVEPPTGSKRAFVHPSPGSEAAEAELQDALESDT